MARKRPTEWKGARVPLDEELISADDARGVLQTAGLSLRGSVRCESEQEDGTTKVVNRGRIEFLQHRLNELARYIAYLSSIEDQPTHLQRRRAIEAISTDIKRLRRKLGIPNRKAANVDSLPAALYLELTIPARQLLRDSPPKALDGFATPDTVIRRALDGLNLLETLVERSVSELAITSGESHAHPLDALVRQLGGIYQRLTRTVPGTSYFAGSKDAPPTATGPFVRFGCAAAKLITGKRMPPDAFRSRYERLRRLSR